MHPNGQTELAFYRRAATIAAATLLAALALPYAAGARASGSAGAPLRALAATASSNGAFVFGGFTPQDWPVVVQLSRDRHTISRAAIGLDLKCNSTNRFASGYRVEPDEYKRVPLGPHGRFQASFESMIVRYDDGSFDVYSGRAQGKANSAWTKLSGTWQLHVTEYSTSAAVVDDCDSGVVRWTARR
jgi:hypothetical protein